MPDWPNAERFDALPPDDLARWSRFLRAERLFFPTFIGIEAEELRRGYARLRLPARPEVFQADGVVHGGALSALLDTAAVPAIGTFYQRQPDMLTVSLTVNFVGVVNGEDAVAEAWVEQGGRSMAFVRAEARGAERRALAATASLVFSVKQRPAAGNG